MISEEMARHQARLDGLRDDQINDEVLKLYGYQRKNPVAGIVTTPYMDDPAVRQAVELLEAEGKKNKEAMGEDIWKALSMVTGIVRTAVKFSIIFVLLLTMGCGSQKHEQARTTVQQVEANLISYTSKRDAFDERMIAYFRASEHSRIQLIYENALNSLKEPRAKVIKKTVKEQVVGADGQPAYRDKVVEEVVETHVVEENAVKALGKQRLRLIQQTEMTVLEMREMLKEIEVDAANAKTLLAGLDAYFAQRVTTLDAVSQAQKGLIGFLGEFLRDKEERAAPGVERLPELTRGSTP